MIEYIQYTVYTHVQKPHTVIRPLVLLTLSSLLGKLLFNLTGHESVVRDLVFTPNGRLSLVSASRDKTLRVWDLAKKGDFIHLHKTNHE